MRNNHGLISLKVDSKVVMMGLCAPRFLTRVEERGRWFLLKVPEMAGALRSWWVDECGVSMSAVEEGSCVKAAEVDGESSEAEG
jgi:hypothetical protein